MKNTRNMACFGVWISCFRLVSSFSFSFFFLATVDFYVVCGEYSCCTAYSEVSNTEYPHLRGRGLWALERDTYGR